MSNLQVHFVPNNRNKLVSASVDGLICLFNTEGDINDDDHLDSVSFSFLFSKEYMRERERPLPFPLFIR